MNLISWASVREIVIAHWSILVSHLRMLRDVYLMASSDVAKPPQMRNENRPVSYDNSSPLCLQNCSRLGLPFPPATNETKVMIILLNPRSARWKHRLPLSVLSLGAVIEGRYRYFIIDGNLEPDVQA